MKSTRKQDENSKIIVINIMPANIRNTIKNTVHGVKVDSAAAVNVEKLNKGDVCIIRQTSRERRYSNGAIGIWYYYDNENIEGKPEPLWIPSTGWKFKLIMKPLVKVFREPFFEEFSSEISEQNKDRKSLKVNDLLTTDVQEEITLSDRDPEMFKRYLKAIIEEKKEECDIQAYYEKVNGNKTIVNVYEFLTDLVGEVSYIEANRGEKSRNAPILATKQKRVQDRTKNVQYRTKSVQQRPRIDPSVEIDETQIIELTEAGIAFCPNCGTLMRPKLTNIGTSVYFCKDCNKAFSPKSK